MSESRNIKDIIIIGAGLSGLYLATLLQERFNVRIIEARQRVGGRIQTIDGHDMGPSWIWQHHKHILQLITELDLTLFPQFTQGLSLYDSAQGVQKFSPPPSAPSARVEGGLSQVISALEFKLDKTKVMLNEVVESIIERADGLELRSDTSSYSADIIISTLPPRLACESISYIPELSSDVKRTLLDTPTWMGNSAKCVVEFKEAFWRGEGLSGAVFSHKGPLGEIHDASTASQPALFGFLHSSANIQTLEDDVKAQMFRLFGERAKDINNIYFTDWRAQRFTSSSLDKQALSSHPDYGFDLRDFDNRLFFIGTESAKQEGGYLDGAIYSAKVMAKKLGISLD